MSVLSRVEAKDASHRKSFKMIGLPLIGVVMVLAIGLNTTVIRHTDQDTADSNRFTPESFGRSEFPGILAWIEDNAVDWRVLYDAIAENRSEAIATYSHSGGAFAVFPVTVQGVISEGSTGNLSLELTDAPEGLTVRMQSGPVVNGTELRDATGTISFQDFTNQIEYQDAGQALNNAMRSQILDRLDRDALAGSQIEATGVFSLINPNSWLITPVRVHFQ